MHTCTTLTETLVHHSVLNIPTCDCQEALLTELHILGLEIY